jgi:hypothetical protein
MAHGLVMGLRLVKWDCSSRRFGVINERVSQATTMIGARR